MGRGSLKALAVTVFLVSCGGSASRGDSQAPPPGGSSGVAGGPTAGAASATAGASAVAGAGGVATAGTGPGSGGISSGGLGGLGGLGSGGALPDLSLPPGCRPRDPSETTELCSLAMDCDDLSSLRTSCHRLEDENWECNCAFHEETYHVENAVGIHACALAARLCSDPELELAEESCERTDEPGDPESCHGDITCTTPIRSELGGARAWQLRLGSVDCNRTDEGYSFRCSCVDGTRRSDYELVVEGGEGACAVLAATCVSGEEPDFVGEEACVPGFFESDGQWCQRFARCGPTSPLTDEARLVEAEERFASCEPGADGGSECSCSEHDSVFSFQVPTPPNDASCEAANPLCNPNATVEATGAPRCAPPAISVVYEDMCTAFMSCVQDATVDEQNVVARANLALSCRRLESGKPWACSCVSGPETSRLELGALGADATQACTQASTACLGDLGLHIGPFGDPASPPDPLL